MRVSFLVNRIQGGWKPTDKRLGGTEESVVHWSEELRERGHTVDIYDNDNRDTYDGGYDVCINVKSSDIAPREPTLYLTNEVDADKLDLSKYKGVIFPSQWAVDNIPVNNKTFILPHGYDETKITSRKKVKKQCLYASSPDRGLRVLEQIWPSVIEKHSDAHLYVTYGGVIDAPNVTCGEFTDDEMNDLFSTSEVWLHPCSGGELYGISGIKAQAGGTIPVYFPTMALAETVQVGIPVTSPREMYQELVDLLGDEKAKADYRKELAELKLPTWKTSTDILEKIMMSIC